MARFARAGPRCFSWIRSLAPGHLVVRSFLRDADVVRVALAQARAADPDEPRQGAQLLDVAHAAVAHPGSESAYHLEHRRRQRTLERDPALDALGDQLRQLF